MQPEMVPQVEANLRVNLLLVSVVYVLDRYASVSTGWAFEYGDEEVVRRLPCRDDNWMAGAVSV